MLLNLFQLLQQLFQHSAFRLHFHRKPNCLVRIRLANIWVLLIVWGDFSLNQLFAYLSHHKSKPYMAGPACSLCLVARSAGTQLGLCAEDRRMVSKQTHIFTTVWPVSCEEQTGPRGSTGLSSPSPPHHQQWNRTHRTCTEITLTWKSLHLELLFIFPILPHFN